MPHILIIDEDGNVIGSSNEGHREGVEHEPTTVTLNVGQMLDLHGVKHKDKDEE